MQHGSLIGKPMLTGFGVKYLPGAWERAYKRRAFSVLPADFDMIDQEQVNGADAAQLPRNKDGSIRKTFVKSVARKIETTDASGLREMVGKLHESDMGALIEALEPEQRPRLVELLGLDFDYTALTEVDDAVREEILDELPSQAVAKGVSELESDDAVAILEDLPKDEQAEILEQLPQPERIAPWHAASTIRKTLRGGACRPSSLPSRRPGTSAERLIICARLSNCRTVFSNSM